VTVKNDDSTKNLGTLLQNIFHQKQWDNRIGMHQVFLFWDEIFGDLAERAQPDVIRGDTLWVQVTDSVWMQQLQFEKQALLDQINRKLSQLHKRSEKNLDAVPQIKAIKFKLATSFNKVSHPVPELTPRSQTVPVDAAQLQKFEATVNSISDERIKKSLIHLWIAQQSRDKTHRIG